MNQIHKIKKFRHFNKSIKINRINHYRIVEHSHEGLELELPDAPLAMAGVDPTASAHSQVVNARARLII